MLTNYKAMTKLLDQTRKIAVEGTLVISMTFVSVAVFLFPEYADWLRHLYVIPVVIASLLLAWQRASAFTVLGVSLVLIVCQSTELGSDNRDLVETIIWGCSLATASAIIGIITSQKEIDLSTEISVQKSLANTDPLTKVANRRTFPTYLERIRFQMPETGSKISLLVIDIDNFKNLNDKFGHQIGDAALIFVAQKIQTLLRETDLLARIGGEEFGVLLPKTDLHMAMSIGERIRKNIASSNLEIEALANSRLTVSIGVAELRNDEHVDSFIERADNAMFLAKRRGRNRVFSQATLTKEHENSSVLPQELFEQAVSRHEVYDSVTGLLQKQVFLEYFERLAWNAERHKFPLCAIKVTVTQKQNESKSESNAKIYREIGNEIANSIRKGDLATWFDPTTFLILLPHAGVQSLEQVILRLCRNMAQSNANTMEFGFSTGEYDAAINKDEFIESILRCPGLSPSTQPRGVKNAKLAESDA